MTRKLQFPDMVCEELGRRYARNRKDWLAGGGQWPLAITLGQVSESDAGRQTGYVRDWINAWHEYTGPGELTWRQRRWRILGTQQMPERLLLASPEDVSGCIGETMRWQTAWKRYRRMTARWPLLQQRLVRHFDILADYSDADFNRLETLLAWLVVNPRSMLYPRQLPIAGLDSKWLEVRKGLIVDLICALNHADSASMDFYRCCGLRQPAALVRLRICDFRLRQQVGGLCDITAPVDEIARLEIPARRVFIVENLQTGISFDDLSGAVVFMGLGYGVDLLAGIDWIRGAQCIYWGDIDTHGFAILNRARAYLPHLESRLMDEETLLGNALLWGEEKQPHPADFLPRLTADEQYVYHGLKEHRWGMNVRLEQERIPWPEAWTTLMK